MSWIPVSSPHWHSGATISGVMRDVLVALAPACLASVWLFGWLAVFHLALTTAACVAFEALALALRGEPVRARLSDLSAAVSGLLLGMSMPPGAPWWLDLVGAAFAMLVVKHAFGGLGANPFNPAIAARVFLMVSFPLPMTLWLAPAPLHPPVNLYDPGAAWTVFAHGLAGLPRTDAVTTASPLGAWQTALKLHADPTKALAGLSLSELLFGLRPGSVGETPALLLLAGGLWLVKRNVITWHVPASYLATVALVAFLAHALDPARFAPASFHLLSGGLMLAAWFMATDPVTCPSTPLGRLAFGAGCGLLTWIIRSFGSYPEGAMFAILFMNAASPLLERHLRPRVYGR